MVGQSNHRAFALAAHGHGLSDSSRLYAGDGAQARLVQVNRRKLGFEVEVVWRDTVVMIGTHDRAVIDLRAG